MPISPEFENYVLGLKKQNDINSFLVSDEELGLTDVEQQPPKQDIQTKGQKMLSEVPTLQEAATASPWELTKGIVKGIGGVAQRTAEKTVEGFSNLGDVAGTAIAGIRYDLTPEQKSQILEDIEVQKKTQEYADFISKKGEQLGLAASFAVPSATLSKIPQSAGTVQKIATGALAGAEGIATQKVALEGELPTAGDIALGATVGAALPAAGVGLQKVVKKIKGPTPIEKEVEFLKNLSQKEVKRTSAEKLADRSTASLNRILPTDQQEFERLANGKNYGQWLNERGINKGLEKNIETLSNKFIKEKNALDDAIAEIPGKYKPTALDDVLEDSLAWANETKDIVGQKLLNGLKIKLETEGGLPAKDILDIKRYFERNNKLGYSKELNAKQIQRATNIDDQLREQLLNIAESQGFKEMRDVSKEIQQTRFLLDNIAKANARVQGKELFNISDRVLAGVSVLEPMTLLGIAGSKFLSSETLKSALARILTRKRISIPEPKLARIRQKVKELQEIDKKKKKDLTKIKKEQVKQALLADELQKKGVVLGEDFIMVKDMPLTREEQLLMRTSKNKKDAEDIALFIIDQRSKGNAVGDGFILKDVENTPILNPTNPINTQQKLLKETPSKNIKSEPTIPQKSVKVNSETMPLPNKGKTMPALKGTRGAIGKDVNNSLNVSKIPDELKLSIIKRNSIESELSEVSATIADIEKKYPGEMGGVSDKGRSLEEFKQAKREYQVLSKKIKDFNSSEEGKRIIKFMNKFDAKTRQELRKEMQSL